MATVWSVEASGSAKTPVLLPLQYQLHLLPLQYQLHLLPLFCGRHLLPRPCQAATLNLRVSASTAPGLISATTTKTYARCRGSVEASGSAKTPVKSL